MAPLPPLDAARSAAVDRLVASLDLPAKIGQLSCAYLTDPDTEHVLAGWRKADYAPGGVLLLARDGAKTRADVALAQEWSSVPLLVAANLEEGAGVVGTDDDAYANPLQVGATGDPAQAGRLGLACGSIGRDLGVNWAFAPVVDLSLNPQNPIIRTRTFGRDPRLVAAMGAAYVSAVQSCGVAASLKHWPGDGVDGRDQHLVTTDNTLDLDTWRSTFGAVYRAGIDAGALTVMAGHIRLPAVSGAPAAAAGGADLPATLSPALLDGLLRGELGFDGLVVSDNTAMAGYSTVMAREQALPASLNAGCDMLLGAFDPLEDQAIVLRAVERGEVPVARIDEALRRVLTVKARLGLLDGTAPPVPEVPRADIRAWRRECAERAVTLVHDRAGHLPLSAGRHPRVLVYVLGDQPTFYDPTGGHADRFTAGLAARGMTVTTRRVPGEGRSIRAEREVQRAHDLVVYFADVRFAGNSNDYRISWSHPQAPEVPRHVDVPTVMVSIADPYHLRDVPSVGTFVNAYSPTAHTVDAVLAALFGDIPFQGTSPVDAWTL
ncbi:glycoside hydrolase family 3 protein [Blastococcus sp. SYSU D00820]